MTLTILYDISDIQHHGGEDARVHLIVLPKPRHLDDEAGRNLKRLKSFISMHCLRLE